MKLLIANRGEIAVRIIRACREMGIGTVAVYSDVDRLSPHVLMADETFPIGPAPASDSYLNMDRLLEACATSRANMVHPGYGFLAENAEFAERCAEAGLTFIGPPPEAMEVMGLKIAARKVMQAAGVPVVPGTEGGIPADEDESAALAEKIGYPVMIKADAGGGGKGMRLVRSADEIKSALRGAASEAGASFGNATVYMEKFVERPRHIEIQVMGDRQGNVIHFGERECSIQRRHQKVIEECPSPVVSEEMRAAMGEVAVKAAKAVNYHNAGTIEFLVDPKMNFYFLEMNTRLQVEHPVTELVTGTDLVKMQLEVAAGRPLPMTQEDVKMRGAAIECRIYAEDPAMGFLPSPGPIHGLRQPGGPGIRDDSAIYPGGEVTIHYDPLISKLSTWGRTRAEAIERMMRALEEYKILGIKTNIPFHERVMREPHFISGDFDTSYIDRLLGDDAGRPLEAEEDRTDVALVAAALAAYRRDEKIAASAPVASGDGRGAPGWRSCGWRNQS